MVERFLEVHCGFPRNYILGNYTIVMHPGLQYLHNLTGFITFVTWFIHQI